MPPQDSGEVSGFDRLSFRGTGGGGGGEAQENRQRGRMAGFSKPDRASIAEPRSGSRAEVRPSSILTGSTVSPGVQGRITGPRQGGTL